MKYNHFSLLPEHAFQPRCGRFGMTLESGAADFVGDVFEGVGNAIEDVVDFTGDVVEGVVEGVRDVGSDIDDFVNDEIPGGWGTVAAVTLMATTGVPTDFGASAAGAAEAGTAAGLGAADAITAAEWFGGTGAATSPGAIFGSAAPSAAAATLGLDELANIIPEIGFTPTDPIIPTAVDVLPGYVPSGAEIIDRSIPFDPVAYEQFGGVSGALTGLRDLASAGLQTVTQNPLETLRVANTANNLYNALTADPTIQTNRFPSNFAGSVLRSPLGMGTPVSGGLPGNLEAQALAAAPVTTTPPSPMNLIQLKQLYPQLSTVDPKLLQMLTNRGGSTTPSYYTYGAGGESPTGERTALSLTASGGLPTAGYPSIATDRDSARSRLAGEIPGYMSTNPLSTAGLSMLAGRSPYGFAKGGQAHNPEFITGATGHYVQGRGDGQSDEIPAMLADGEYVFDADTVAALGNGSSKAGAATLDKMRENIRKHKRSASHKDIPPKAKSPLAYMKG